VPAREIGVTSSIGEIASNLPPNPSQCACNSLSMCTVETVAKWIVAHSSDPPASGGAGVVGAATVKTGFIWTQPGGGAEDQEHNRQRGPGAEGDVVTGHWIGGGWDR
jgi:hypothetical protein